MSASDYCLSELALKLDSMRGQSVLWVADEHPIAEHVWQCLQSANVYFLSNRFDQVLAARSRQLSAGFNDFSLESPNEAGWDAIFFRIAKEKAVCHRVANQARLHLRPAGKLWIAGLKQEGVKSLLGKISEAWGMAPRMHKAQHRVILAELGASQSAADLDDQDYAQVREIEMTPGRRYFSKPGLFGWQRIDAGSEFLVRELSQESLEQCSVLDLGCGYGYLSVAAAELGASKIVATDNCASALAACRVNLSNLNSTTTAEVVASDSGKQLEGVFDRILCNPPFHSGFGTGPELHQAFLRQISRLLAPEGEAWLVVNQFLRLENLASENRLAIKWRKRDPDNRFDLYCFRHSG